MPNDKQLKDVTTDELVSLCKWASGQAAKVDLSDEQLCTSDAVQSSSDTEECTQMKEACLADPSSVQDSGLDECDSATTDSISASCEATVADIGSCFEDLISTYTKWAKSASCDTLDTSPDLPASCTSAAMRGCPLFFEP